MGQEQMPDVWSERHYPDLIIDLRHASLLPDPIEQVTIPSPAEVEQTYAAVASKANITLPEDINLGQLLAHLRPIQEHLFRARQGMFPFTSPMRLVQIAQHYGMPTVVTAHQEIGHVRHSIHRLNLDQTSPPTPTLEKVARLLCRNEGQYEPQPVDILCALRGLPPYRSPYSTSELAARYGLCTETLQRRYDRQLALL